MQLLVYTGKAHMLVRQNVFSFQFQISKVLGFSYLYFDVHNVLKFYKNKRKKPNANRPSRKISQRLLNQSIAISLFLLPRRFPQCTYDNKFNINCKNFLILTFWFLQLLTSTELSQMDIQHFNLIFVVNCDYTIQGG